MNLRPLLVSLLTLLPMVSHAGFVVDVAGSREIQLAAPRPIGGDAETVASFYKALDNDLKQSGYFTVIDPNASLDKGGAAPGTFDFDSWNKLKVGVLVKTQFPSAAECGGGENRCVDAWVYYVVNGQTLSANRFRTTGEGRALGHEVANEVVFSVTGQRSFFGGRLAAVGRNGGNKEIYLLDTDGEGVTPATRNGSINLSPSIAPGGGLLAWTSYKKGNPDLYVKNLRSGKSRVLSNLEGINASPAFSPDGSMVAMTRSTGGNSDIYVLDATSGKVMRRLTDNPGIDVGPNFSPDGTKIVYASEASGGSQIYVADAVSGSNRRVTFQGSFNTDPVFSPDGTKIAFVGRDGGGFDVFVVNLDGTGLLRITQGMRDNEDPAWSPDGRYLVFSSTRNGGSQLWMSTADGRHQSQLTTGGSWSQPTFVY